MSIDIYSVREHNEVCGQLVMVMESDHRGAGAAITRHLLMARDILVQVFLSSDPRNLKLLHGLSLQCFTVPVIAPVENQFLHPHLG